MTTPHFSAKDMAQLKKHAISPQQAGNQLKRFKLGFPPIELVHPCKAGKGIVKLSPLEQKQAIKIFLDQAPQKSILKFVPASGAASRMFHFLEDSAPEHKKTKQIFLKELSSFAFYSELAKTLKKHGQEIEKLKKEEKFKVIVRFLLENEGLGYRQAPKGMILFHRVGKQMRTAFEEQLSEALIFKNAKKKTQIHFTLPSSARSAVQKHIKKASRIMRQPFTLSDSIQSPATDCLAVEKKGVPVRDKNEALLFRPAGHGALLMNLNQMKADVIYVKNIDNILPKKNRGEADRWKRILCGVFLHTQERIFAAQRSLDKKTMSPQEALSILRLAHELGWDIPQQGGARKKLEKFFNRPLRVCGMVPNTGEPGGGPFWVRNQEGSVSPQIVESAEVDFKKKSQKQIWMSSTHFNPVDFVCGAYNYRGKKYDLSKFSDEERGLIAKKSYQGREIQVMELPGLWNGGMAHWISVFVEIPGEVFAPVKTVLDLLRKEHQTRL